jgi:inorganic pyrophosphatase/exopolyphosphatase
MLQGINTFIDTVQGAKSTFVKTFVQDKEVAKSLQSYVDTQTQFVKTAAQVGHDLTFKTAQEVVKFDVKKFFGTK